MSTIGGLYKIAMRHKQLHAPCLKHHMWIRKHRGFIPTVVLRLYYVRRLCKPVTGHAGVGNGAGVGWPPPPADPLGAACASSPILQFGSSHSKSLSSSSLQSPHCRRRWKMQHSAHCAGFGVSTLHMRHLCNMSRGCSRAGPARMPPARATVEMR